MPTFEYKALDKRGKEIRGLIDAPDENVIVERLRVMGYHPLSIKRRAKRSADEIRLEDLPGARQIYEALTGHPPEGEETADEAAPAAPVESAPALPSAHRILPFLSPWKILMEMLRGRSRPALVARKCLAIELLQDRLRLAEMTLESESVRIGFVHVGSIPVGSSVLPKQWIAAAASEIRRILRQNGIAHREVICCFPGEAALVEEMLLPATTEPRIERMVLYEFSQRLAPSPPRLVAYETQQAESGEFQVIAIALNEELFNRYQQTLQKARLTSIGVCSGALDESEMKELKPYPLKRPYRGAKLLLALAVATPNPPGSSTQQ